MQGFQGGLVFQAHILSYYSTQGLRTTAAFEVSGQLEVGPFDLVPWIPPRRTRTTAAFGVSGSESCEPRNLSRKRGAVNPSSKMGVGFEHPAASNTHDGCEHAWRFEVSRSGFGGHAGLVAPERTTAVRGGQGS